MAYSQMCLATPWYYKPAAEVAVAARRLKSWKKCGRRSCYPLPVAMVMPLQLVTRKVEKTWSGNCSLSSGAWDQRPKRN